MQKNPHLSPFRGPHFRHDCDACRYRGSFVLVPTDAEKLPRVFDVYICGDISEDSIILRSSSEAPNYESFPRPLAEKIASEYDTSGAWTYALNLVRSWKTHRLRSILRPDYDDREFGFQVDKTAQLDRTTDYGGATVVFSLVSWPEDVHHLVDTASSKRDILHRHFPATQCQHSHDCCGNFYASTARIHELPNGKWLVRQSWTQNV